MKISNVPKSALGKWSIGLGLAFMLFFLLTETIVGLEVFGPQFNPVLAVVLTIKSAVISGAAFITGLLSIIRGKEISALVLLSMVITLWFGLIGSISSLII
jgi:hypothetical protein